MNRVHSKTTAIQSTFLYFLLSIYKTFFSIYNLKSWTTLMNTYCGVVYMFLSSQIWIWQINVKYQCPSQTAVVSVRHSPHFAVTGQWEVETQRREGQKETHVFDAVIVCTGHFTQPHLPLRDFPGTRNHDILYIHNMSLSQCSWIGVQLRLYVK